MRVYNGEYIKGIVVMLALHLVALLPFRLCQWLGAAVGWCHWILNSRSARVTDVNLKLCLPDLDPKTRAQLVKLSLIQTGQTMLETPAIWLGSNKRNLSRIIRVTGEDVLAEQLNAHKGVILILLHLGNWELFPTFYGARSTMTVLYQPPRLRSLDQFIRMARTRTGNTVVPTTREGLLQLYRTLHREGVVVILPDQVPASGVVVPFFGVDALTDLLIPRLVKKTGAGVACVYVKRLDGGDFEVVFRRAQVGIASADPEVSAAAVNASLEACVREIPEQYQWAYKRFRMRSKDQPNLYAFSNRE